jgi:CheY-like chemotaxis protein/HPt (histidine-containing phosphotransfer) domain-containing protein
MNVVGQSSVDQNRNVSREVAPIITKHSLGEIKPMPYKLILLAEDNVVNQKVAVRQLEKLGYHADVVANGREAIQALARIPYELVLMDCQMPEMDGYEATAQIRSLEGVASRTKIVAMTANALEGDRERCLSAGMDDYISKPVRAEELAKVLERMFAASDHDRECEAPSVSPPVDIDRVYESMGEEPEELHDILNTYLKEMSQNVVQLNAAIESGDVNKIGEIAHNCAGVSANCGMVAVVGPLRELERLGREGSVEGGAALGAQVTKEFERVKLFLQENLLPVTI